MLTGFSPAANEQRQILDLDGSRQPVELANWGDYWIDPAGSLPVEALARVPAEQWKPTHPGITYHLKGEEVLWVRVAVPAADDTQRWFLKVPNPGLDKMKLYTRESTGEWSNLVAGDRIAQAQWPMPHRYPVFPLAVSAAEPSYYLLRIESSGYFSAPILFENERGLSLSQQSHSIALGVYFGLLVTAAVLMAAYSIIDRSFTQFWFGLWAVMLLLTIASALGVAGMYLWPQAPQWNDLSEQVLALLSFVPLLLFVAQSVSVQHRMRWYFRLMIGLALAMPVIAAALAWVSAPIRLPVTIGASVLASLICAWPLVWVARNGESFGVWLLACLAPLALAPLVPLARALHWLPYSEWISYSVPTGAGLSVGGIFLLLTERAQAKRDRKRRLAQLDQIDATTGLPNDAVFLQRMENMIVRSQRMQHNSLVVMVEISNYGRLSQEHGRRRMQALLLQLGARLAMCTRSTDMVARFSDSRFGLVFEGPVPNDRGRLSGLATRILTQCMNANGGLPADLNAQVRLGLILIPSQAPSADAAISRLEQLLRGADADGKRTIFFAETAPPSQPAES